MEIRIYIPTRRFLVVGITYICTYAGHSLIISRALGQEYEKKDGGAGAEYKENSMLEL